MAVDLFVKVWRALSHVGHGVFIRDVGRDQDGCMIMAQIVKGAGNTKLFAEPVKA